MVSRLVLPVGMCSIDIIRPPGTTFKAHSPLLISTGVLESSISLRADVWSTSGIHFAVSAVYIRKIITSCNAIEHLSI